MGKHSRPAETKPQRVYCDECDRSFSRADSLKYHKLRCHQAPWKPLPFICKFCQQGYPKSSQMTAHMQRAHSATHFFDCVECDGTFRLISSLKHHYHFVHELRRSKGQQAVAGKRPSTSNRGRPRKRQSLGLGQEPQQLMSTPGESSDDENSEMDDDQWYASLNQEGSIQENGTATTVAHTPPTAAVADSTEVKPPSKRRESLFTLLEQKFETNDSTATSVDVQRAPDKGAMQCSTDDTQQARCALSIGLLPDNGKRAKSSLPAAGRVAAATSGQNCCLNEELSQEDKDTAKEEEEEISVEIQVEEVEEVEEVEADSSMQEQDFSARDQSSWDSKGAPAAKIGTNGQQTRESKRADLLLPSPINFFKSLEQGESS